MDIGAICNNASLVKNEDGVYVGQSTDVALLNVLSLFGLPDRRDVRFTVSMFMQSYFDFPEFRPSNA